MTNYYVYYENLSDVKKWKEYQESKKSTKRSIPDKDRKIEFDEKIPKECTPIKFKKGELVTDKLTLEDIDCLTSGFKDQEEFFNTMKKHSEYDSLFTDGTNKNFIIVYKHKGEYRKHDIIYNNPLLQECALEVKRETSKGKNRSEVVLNITKELEHFTSRIKEYAIANTNGFRESRLISYKLKEALDEYVNLKQNDTYLSTEEYEYLNFIENSILKYIRNYKTLRKLMLWEQKYMNKQNDIEEEYHQQELALPTIEGISDKIYSPQKTEIDYMLEEDEDELMKWYKLGLQENNGDRNAAIEMVFRNVPDIYSYPEDELEKVGIITSSKGKRI